MEKRTSTRRSMFPAHVALSGNFADEPLNTFGWNHVVASLAPHLEYGPATILDFPRRSSAVPACVDPGVRQAAEILLFGRSTAPVSEGVRGHLSTE